MFFQKLYISHIFLFVIIIFSILVTNNQSLDFENLFFSSFSDGFTFLNIFSASPQLALEQMSLHHAQRFISYYVLGLIYNFIKIDVKIFLQIIVIFFLFLNFLALNILFNNLKIKSDLKFLVILIFFLIHTFQGILFMHQL